MMTVLERSLAEVSQELQVSGTPDSTSCGEMSVCPFLGGRTVTRYALSTWSLSGMVRYLITRTAQQPVHLNCSLM